MTPIEISLIGLGFFLLFSLLGMPIAFSFALVGGVGTILVKGPGAGFSLLGNAPYTWATNSNLIALPMFLLMGQWIFHSGISGELYETCYKWVGKYRGGLAIATELASTAFGACSGTSLASAATMGTVAYPEMAKRNYSPRLACGSIAAGGSLSSLIPPSAPFIVYGFMTNTSVGKLFISGILPGILLSLIFISFILFMCWRNPSLGPPGPAFSLKERLLSMRGVMGAIIIFIIVMGGLFAGIFTPGEAGTIGAFGAFVLILLRRRLNRSTLTEVMKSSILNTCFVLTITIGAMIFTNFLTVSGFTSMFSGMIRNLPLSPDVIMICIILIYIPLGCVMDSLAMILLTVPIVFPIINGFGYDPIWFGVILIIISELALLTPPVGMNTFVVHGITKVPLSEVFRGVTPFCIAMLAGVALIFIFPEIATFLPAVVK